MSTMTSIRLPYKQDTYDKPLFADVHCAPASSPSPRPIALIFHAGGLLVGGSTIVPKAQIKYLCNHGFVVVIPNYRLAPQVSGKRSFDDCEDACDWAIAHLPEILEKQHDVKLDTQQVVAMGHSSGGTIAMHLAGAKSLKAATAFYPSLYSSDKSTSIHQPTTAPPFCFAQDFVPSDQDKIAISPADHQVSEFQLGAPPAVPQARNKWQMHVLKHGLWAQTVQPDGNLAAVDPMTRVSANWAPIMIVQGETDVVPGSGLDLAQRAQQELKAAGVREVELEVVPGAGHMFDLAPEVGTTDVTGLKWQAIAKGLDWLATHTSM
ncbi:hypothetical protein LTR62_003751 [Meristemomyces frigidus]|uniref:Alpha/beta hydrolase fold-3 domain-containing protein n=1 Tax=Meristemomyces frigidus TaxID=1508187 RepID=A0AAN7TGZ3_9PEZI|nr:hypothetical protein LTR62_003751 [Meristemomyces frigidus]